MARFVYPAVVINDKEEDIFIITVPDLHIVCEGETIAESMVNAKRKITLFLRCALEFNANIPMPSDKKVIESENPNNQVVFIQTEVNDGDLNSNDFVRL
jgi:predicted RNase H-like HicB family nuclease